MCKYCERLEPLIREQKQKPLYEDPTVILQVAQDTPIGRRLGYSPLDILVGTEARHIQINYCPICGRRLNIDIDKISLFGATIKKTKEKYLEEHDKNPLQVIKFFYDKLSGLGIDELDIVRYKMRYLGEGRLKFAKDMYDSDRLDELERAIEEVERDN